MLFSMFLLGVDPGGFLPSGQLTNDNDTATIKCSGNEVFLAVTALWK